MRPGPRNLRDEGCKLLSALRLGAGAARAGLACNPPNPVLIVRAVDGAVANFACSGTD